MLAWLTLRMLIFDRGGNSVKSAEISHEGTQKRNKTSGGLLSIYFCVIFSKWIPLTYIPYTVTLITYHAAWVTCDQITHSLASLSHYIKTKPSYQFANFLYKKTSGSAFVPKLKFNIRLASTLKEIRLSHDPCTSLIETLLSVAPNYVSWYKRKVLCQK